MGASDSKAAYAASVFENSDSEVQKQYELLNILDSKASALLTFNAVALASITIWLAYVSINVLHLALDLVFLVLLASCARLLAIIALRWAGASDDPSSLDATRIRRTKHYKGAWRLSIGSIACLIGISGVHTIGTVLVVTGNCGGSCAQFYSEDVFGNLDAEK